MKPQDIEQMERDLDRVLRIRTSGRDDSQADTYRYPYEPTPYAVLERLAGSGWIRKGDTLLDYGCGKGRVGLYLSRQTRCSSLGIDYDPRMYREAEANRRTAVSGSRVLFLEADAEKYEIPGEVNRLYFFNPFSVELLRSVLARVFDSWYGQPREILLFFYYPSDEYVGCLMTTEGLEFFDEIDCRDIYGTTDPRENILIFRIEG